MFAAFEWVASVFNSLIIRFLARPIFWIMSICFEIFNSVAKLNIFGMEGGTGTSLYDTFTERIYSIITIVMVFVFAYQIILLIVNPDGDTKATSAMFKNIIISVISVIIAPLIFNYAAILQNHIIDDGTIQKIFLNQKGGNGTKKSGWELRKSLIIAFYHPEGMGYNDFYGNDGKMCTANTNGCGDAMGNCLETLKPKYGDGDATKICNAYISWLKSIDRANAYSPFQDMETETLGKYDGGNGFVCDAIIMVIVGIYVTWLFLSYSLDLGVRAIKLFALQIIAPIPLILRIMPNTKKVFDKWSGELLKTYLEVFFRLAFIFLIVFMCSQVHTMINQIFTTGMDSSYNGIVTVIIILGLCKFAKDAPESMKKIFDLGGNLLAGIDFKGGVRSRIKDNTYAMKGIDAGRGALFGATTSQDGFKNRLGGALRGGAYGGMYGLEKGKKELDTYRTEVANGSTFRGRMLSRTAKAFGLETAAEAEERRMNRRTETLFHNADRSESNKAIMNLITEMEDTIKKEFNKAESGHVLNLGNLKDTDKIGNTTMQDILKQNGFKVNDMSYSDAESRAQMFEQIAEQKLKNAKTDKQKKAALEAQKTAKDVRAALDKAFTRDVAAYMDGGFDGDGKLISNEGMSPIAQSKIESANKQIYDKISAGNVGVMYDDAGTITANALASSAKLSDVKSRMLKQGPEISAHSTTTVSKSLSANKANDRMVNGTGRSENK